MITKRETKLSQVMVVVQVIISILLFCAIDFFFPSPVFNAKEKTYIVIQIALIWSVLFYKLRLGIIFRATSFGNMIRGYLATIGFGSILLFLETILLPFITHSSDTNLYIAIFCLLNVIILTGFKLLFYYSMRYLRRKGHNSRNVIIVADSNSFAFIDSFIRAKDWGYRVAAIVSYYNEFKNRYKHTHIIKKQETLKKYITVNAIDDVFYCLPVSDEHYNLEQLIQECDEIGVSLHIMQESYYNSLKKKKNFDFSFVTHQTTPTKYISLKIKALFDIVFSVLVLFFSSPLLALTALFIKLEDGGPVFFKQERIGLNGRRFSCYKFRSMVVNAEEMIVQLKELNESDGPTFKIKKDPRVTKIGRLIRKTSIDELPQFLNVIKGEMSVVGPRPPLLWEVKQYERSQLRRLSMKPGITCKWQVWGRNKVSFKEWMSMDLDYIDHWSLLVDMKIIIATVGVVFKANGQ